MSTIDGSTPRHRPRSEALSGCRVRATLPIRPVDGPADIAALAVHNMSNTALTGATYDVDSGQRLVR